MKHFFGRRKIPPVSEAQRRFFRWAAANPKESGVSKSVSREFNVADPGGKLPERKQVGGGLGDRSGSFLPMDTGTLWQEPLARPRMGFAMRPEPMPEEEYGYGVGQTDPTLRPSRPPPSRMPWPSLPLYAPASEVARQTYSHNPLPIYNPGRVERSSEHPRQTMTQIEGDPLAPQRQAKGGRLASTGKTAEIAAAIRRAGTAEDPEAAAVATRVKMIGRKAVQEKAAAARAGKKYYADGGYVRGLGTRPRLQMGGMGMMRSADMPWWTRSEAIQDERFGGGLIPSSGAGRTDQLPLAVMTESHVIPAAEVAGLGQGNTLAGARILSAALKVGPWGSQPLPSVHGRGPPQPPAFRFARPAGLQPGEPYVYRQAGGPTGLGSEGGARRETSILAAGGEYVVPRHDWLSYDEHGQPMLHAGVETLGEGDINKGHDVLNRMIMNIRNHTIKFLKTAPPPKS